MEDRVQTAIERYQCSGCASGCDIKCGKFAKRDWSESCSEHFPGTSIGLFIKIFLGMPTGFNRTGTSMGEKVPLCLDIFKSFDEIWGKDGKPYDHFNIPVWKHLNDDGHTLVRGLSPRNNAPFLHVILEDCMDRIDCFEVTKELMEEMDY
jgi:hypothetical protein